MKCSTIGSPGRPVSLSTLCIAVLATAIVCTSRGYAEQPPNIVFIMADDLGTGHLGFNGQTRIRTPHIDRLRSEGMSFRQAYAGCSVCAPCRSVLMTGYHMGHTSVRANSGGVPLLDEDITVAEVLKQAGYATGGFGKWGLGDAHSPGMATLQGFDTFFGYYDQVHAHSYYPLYLWWNDQRYYLPRNSGRESDGLTGEVRGQHTHDEIQTKILDFIHQNRDRPFFCYVPYTIPHTELLVPDDSMQEYAGRFPEPNPWVDRRGHYADQPQPRAAFAAMVTRMDRGVGEILTLLERLDLAENTIVFFTSDNGAQNGGGPDLEFFQGNGILRGAKGSMYEGGLRVPLVVRWPGRIVPGSESDHPCYFPDVMPTLAELAGAADAVPGDIDGISFVPSLVGAEAAGRDQQRQEYLYWELGGGRSFRRAIRVGTWKAVQPSADAELELYHLERDPSETENVAAQHPEVVEQIGEILARCRTNPRPQQEPEGVNGWAFR